MRILIYLAILALTTSFSFRPTTKEAKQLSLKAKHLEKSIEAPKK